MYSVVDPSTGELLESFDTATDAEIHSALQRSDAAFTVWSQTPVEERAEILEKLSVIYRERSEELAEIIQIEMGKPIPEGKGELVLCSLIYKYFAKNAAEFIEDEPLRGPKDAQAYIHREPVGSLLGIMPWNFPYYQVARFAAPNLALGNTIILKHAPNCPRSARVIEEIFQEAGLPQDAYINVYASNEQIADIVLPSPLNHGVSLTGSERAGSAVAAEAGKNLKKVVLELGGSDPYIVLDSADVDATVKTLLNARLGNNGQACNAPKRMIIMEDLYAEVLKKMVSKVKSRTPEDPYSEESRLSPLSTEQAVSRFVDQVDKAASQGATVHTGGIRYDGPGAFVSPAVITDVTADMNAHHEEIFGPAVILYKASTEDEAVALANDTPFGLGAAVFSADTDRAETIAKQIKAGMVFINTPEQSREFLPFGGVKRSGIGRELGPLAMDEFVNKKLIYKAETGE